MVKKYGGREGVFDFALMHSAIERPKATFGGKELYPTIFDKAAAMIHSLIQNHPFADGNKRTALAITVRFLHLNGYKLIHPTKETIDFALRIQKKKTTFEQISSWLRKHSKKIHLL